jgi:Flp pilus assembly pilin Flp
MKTKTPATRMILVKDERGQAVTEYLLMVATILSFYLIAIAALQSYGLASKLTTPITNDFAKTYQYGKNDVLGFDNGGPKDHPRAIGSGNFRIFINPVKQ